MSKGNLNRYGKENYNRYGYENTSICTLSLEKMPQLLGKEILKNYVD
jgi:hypothetical protein